MWSVSLRGTRFGLQAECARGRAQVSSGHRSSDRLVQPDGRSQFLAAPDLLLSSFLFQASLLLFFAHPQLVHPHWFYWAAFSLFLCVSDLLCFNFHTKNFKIFPGSKETRFGSTVQQHQAGGRQW